MSPTLTRRPSHEMARMTRTVSATFTRSPRRGLTGRSARGIALVKFGLAVSAANMVTDARCTGVAAPQHVELACTRYDPARRVGAVKDPTKSPAAPAFSPFGVTSTPSPLASKMMVTLAFGV